MERRFVLAITDGATVLMLFHSIIWSAACGYSLLPKMFHQLYDDISSTLSKLMASFFVAQLKLKADRCVVEFQRVEMSPAGEIHLKIWYQSFVSCWVKVAILKKKPALNWNLCEKFTDWCNHHLLNIDINAYWLNFPVYWYILVCLVFVTISPIWFKIK